MSQPRKLVAAAAGGAMLAGLIAAPAISAELDPHQTEVTFTLTTGGLAVAFADGSVDLGDVAAGEEHLPTLTDLLPETTVTDARNSSNGWTVSASSTDFVVEDEERVGEPDAEEVIGAANIGIRINLTEAIEMNVRNTFRDLNNPTDLGSLFIPTGGTTGAAGGALGTLHGGPLKTVLGGLLGGLLGGSANHDVTYTPEATVTVPADVVPGEYKGVVSQTVL